MRRAQVNLLVICKRDNTRCDAIGGLVKGNVHSPAISKSKSKVHIQSRCRDSSDSHGQKIYSPLSDPGYLSNTSDETTNHAGCWIIPIMVEGIKTWHWSTQVGDYDGPTSITEGTIVVPCPSPNV